MVGKLGAVVEGKSLEPGEGPVEEGLDDGLGYFGRFLGLRLEGVQQTGRALDQRDNEPIVVLSDKGVALPVPGGVARIGLWGTLGNAYPVGNGRASAGLALTPFSAFGPALGQAGNQKAQAILGVNGLVDGLVAHAHARVAGPIEGTVRLTATTGWEITPEQFSYYVRPGESTTREVVVLGNLETGGSGGVVAETLYSGRTYRDVLELRPRDLELAIVQDEGEVAITARNPNSVAAVGYAELIVPPQYWSELPGARAGSVTPRSAALRIAPLEEQRVLFRYTGDRPPWMVVKVAANGRVLYRNVPNPI